MTRWTTDRLVSSLRLRGLFSVPGSSGGAGGVTDAELLSVMSEEGQLTVAGLLRGMDEGYLTVTTDVAVTGSSFVLPGRAAGQGLRSVGWKLSSGEIIPLNPDGIDISQRDTSAGSPTYYYFDGSSVNLRPIPSTGLARVSYVQRPSDLVLTSACLVITSLSGPSVTGTLPSTFVGATTKYDVVAGEPPFRTKAIDLTATYGSGMMALSSDPGASVGDFVTLAGETPVPLLPVEAHHLLALLGAQVLLRGQGSQRAGLIERSVQEAIESLKKLMVPRHSTGRIAIVSRYGVGGSDRHRNRGSGR